MTSCRPLHLTGEYVGRDWVLDDTLFINLKVDSSYIEILKSVYHTDTIKGKWYVLKNHLITKPIVDKRIMFDSLRNRHYLKEYPYYAHIHKYRSTEYLVKQNKIFEYLIYDDNSNKTKLSSEPLFKTPTDSLERVKFILLLCSKGKHYYR